ncbi:hypothetical protein KBD08_04110 [Candidatus Babeliales bacterium]|nr:hypothetical protein [Candidatus Babeliales bacterium]
MKKFIISILLCSTVASYTAAAAAVNPVHIPVPGQLQIGANPQAVASAGIVMDIITRDPNFTQECDAIRNLLNIRPNQPINQTYQQIVTILNTGAINPTVAIPALQAIEKAIMHKLHYDDYLLFSYSPWTSMFATGIRASWFYPTTYLNPKNLINSTTPDANQLLSELDAIANVAARHSTVMSLRLKTTIASYRNWKKYIATIVLTYLSGDLIAHGHNSAVKKIWNGGLCAIPNAFENLPNNMKAVGKGAYYVGDKAVSVAQYITGPIAQKILYGMNGGNSTTPPTKKTTQPTAPAKLQKTAKPIVPVTEPKNYNFIQPIKNGLQTAKDATASYHQYLYDKYVTNK